VTRKLSAFFVRRFIGLWEELRLADYFATKYSTMSLISTEARISALTAKGMIVL
jgi:hypothetical protein